MNKSSRIYIAGHTGLIGSAFLRRFKDEGFTDIIAATHGELDLTDEAGVNLFFEATRPEYVVLAAGRVGGIIENQTYPVDFINTNLAIQLNVLRAAHSEGVKKLILFASSCMYPRQCPQPMSESALFSGHLEPTSLAYALAKLAGMQMCLAYNQQYYSQDEDRSFIPVIPNSAFGPNDNFNPESGHVLSALIRRFHEAKEARTPSLKLWGSGNVRREFIHADDIADACLMLLEKDTSQLQLPLNLGTGKDFSIRELAETIAEIVGYTGKLAWDRSKPEGTPRKLLDSSRLLAFGWQPKVNFKDGLKSTYQWYLNNQ